MKIKTVIVGRLSPLFLSPDAAAGLTFCRNPFTRERADGKIPVKVELIRKQVRAELDGVPEGESGSFAMASN